jgi:small subunit ribosomal protein S2
MFTMRQLLEAGVHFGHHTRRWNPLMKPFIFGVRNNVHIIDLEQTVPMLFQAMSAVRDVAANGGRVLFVGTKRQAQDKVAAAAQRCGQYYVNHRWLGGMLTNWKTMSLSIKRLRELDEQMADSSRQTGLTKKELLQLSREREKLDRALGGIKEMGGLPDILFIIDVPREELAIQEANKLKIPVVAICDSNANPNGVTYAVPGNDDALRAIELYCDLVAGSVLDGLQAELMASGVDVGESEDVPAGDLPSVDAEMIAAAAPESAQPAA